MERRVNELDVFAQAEKFIRLVGLLQGPLIFMAVKNADFGHDPGILECGRQQSELLANLADFLVDPAGTFEMMGQDGAVKFFRAEARLAPTKKQYGRGPARH